MNFINVAALGPPIDKVTQPSDSDRRERAKLLPYVRRVSTKNASFAFMGDLELTFLYGGSLYTRRSVDSFVAGMGLDRTSALKVALENARDRFGTPTLLTVDHGLYRVVTPTPTNTCSSLLMESLWQRALQEHPNGLLALAHVQAGLLVATGPIDSAKLVLNRCIAQISQDGLSQYLSRHYYKLTSTGWQVAAPVTLFSRPSID
jgi:hypothetical protein